MKKNRGFTSGGFTLNGFTLAEVLVTLTIIGILAAILFPSILANYNERTLKARRQALFGRMSQAMGELTDQFRNYKDVTCTNNLDPTTCTDEGSALKFINEGLSKVYKISAVCDADSLSACDIPDKISLADDTLYELKNAKSWGEYFPQAETQASIFPYDLKSAAFMTKNGESILLFYNPNCQGKSGNGYYTYTMQNICVNMVYDLNGGKKKPNKMGEDIGFMSVFYADMPYVATARPYDWKAVPDYEATTDGTGLEYVNKWNTKQNFVTAKSKCEALGENVGLPSLEEGMSMQVNRELWAPKALQKGDDNWAKFWTNSRVGANQAWVVELQTSERIDTRYSYAFLLDINLPSGQRGITRCVYKD